jgi:hypothetical protein
MAFAWLAAVVIAFASAAQLRSAALAPQQQDPLAEPFRGITTDGNVIPGLFAIQGTGVPTSQVRLSADASIASLDSAQRDRTLFPVDDLEWRKWNNVHRYARQGVSFREMSEPQRERAIALLRASLSAAGLEKTRNVMRLNGHLADLLGRHDEYGDDLYNITVMGSPSATEPWGWQLDGHHLIINYFVLGDQVVMTPTFMGSEPVSATTGRYAGITVMKEEQDAGLAFAQSLTQEQRSRAVVEPVKARNYAQAQAFRDNLVLGYEGIPATALTAAQRELLLGVIAEYVNNMPARHAKVRMDEVRAHMDRTHFAWIGAIAPDAVFYYRIHSPVILIEFDHQGPIALPGTRGVATRAHVHSVVRTPNGNDYGKDLLRLHYEKHAHDSAHGHLPEAQRRTGAARPGTVNR